jgi:HAE1 family hydrophobic/amphiphilic exporter-1
VSFTGLFVRRPVMTTLLMIGILVFGIASYRKLPVSDLPTIDYPTLNVGANLPGASPETMAATVATPLEKAFSAIAGIDEITSNSNTGNTNITLQFGLDRDIEVAAQDVNAAIGKTLPFLPSTILPPNYHKNNPNAMPIMNIALTSNVLPMTQVDEYAQTLIAQRLSMIEGVASVNVFGSAKYAVRVQLDPKQLATRNIGVSQVANAIRQNNVMLPTGVLYGKDRTLTLNATGQMQSAADFRPLIIAYRNGAAVRLRDVANVLDDIQNNKSVSYFDRERSINLFVQRQPGTNTMEIAQRVRDKLEEIKPSLPPTLKLHVQYDRSISIGRAVNDVKASLLVALVLVVAVIFLFLRSAVATLIPSVTLPLAIIGTFSAMYALDFSIDNLSLMALTLAVGFIVDDAIVMLENIVRHIEMGKPPMQAALDGAAEVGFTVLSMCLSLAAVFIPLMFMGGIIGRLFREFAVTISVAVLVSGFIALTLTPMLCSRLLKPHAAERHGRWFNASERGFQAVLRAYERSGARRNLFRVDEHPEGFVPAGRQWIAQRQRRGAAGHAVHGDDAVRPGREREARDGHEHRVVHDERGEHGTVESDSVQHHAEAGGHAPARGSDGVRAPPRDANAGRRRFSDEPAEHPDRRPRRTIVVPIHIARTGHSGTVSSGRAAAQSAAGKPDAEQRELQPAESQPDSEGSHRSE